MQNIFTREALIAWLKTKPADDKYYWPSCTDCLLGIYCRERGIRDVRFTEICGGVLAYHYIAASQPWTFGAALRRAEEYQRNRLK